MPIFDEGFRKSGQNPSIIATSEEGKKNGERRLFGCGNSGRI